MAFGKGIGLKGLTYRGGGPMWAWLLHRISGIGIVLFVGTHIAVSFLSLLQQSKGADALNDIYKSWPVQMFVYFCIIYHVINGLRIVILDFFPRFLKFQREMIWLQWMIFIPLYGLALYFLILRLTAPTG